MVASAVTGVFSDRVPGPDRDREVEGGDHADRPERVPGLGHPVARPLRGDGQAVELAGEADGEVADVDHLLHFAQAFLQDLAGLDRDQPTQLGLVGAQLLAEQAHQLAAARARHGAPVQEGVGRALDRGVDIGFGMLGQAGDLGAVDRRPDDQRAAGQGVGIEPEAADEIVQLHETNSGERERRRR
jgi:hypothetical protein